MRTRRRRQEAWLGEFRIGLIVFIISSFHKNVLLSRKAEIGFGTHHDYSKYFATTAPGKERSVARIPDKDSRLAGVVLEYFGRADEACGTVSRKVDPYLDTITLPHDVISIEVE